jgi:hypothetical protein
MKEEVVVRLIESELNRSNRAFNNLHGTMFSKNGSPDFLTMDKSGRFVGIEAKAPGKSPFVNQYRRAIEILLSKGRYIIAQDDFSLEDLDNEKIEKLKIGSEIGSSEFEAAQYKIKKTTEIII